MSEAKDMLGLVDVLEGELRKGSSVPLTGKRLVDADFCLDILADIRNSMPEALRRANNIIGEADGILKDARVKADELVGGATDHANSIVQSANVEADRLGSEHEITRRAQMQAQDILGEATDHANSLVNRAENHSAQVHEVTLQYVDNTLGDLHESLYQHMRLIGDQIDNMRDVREQLLRGAPEGLHRPDSYQDQQDDGYLE